MKKVIIILTIAALLFLTACSKPKENQDAIDEFAKCLTEKGVKMYGSLTCGHCNNNKLLFGSSFQYINYIECHPRGENEQSELCIEENIEYVPTWEFSDGTRETGEKNFYELAEKTGCKLPN